MFIFIDQIQLTRLVGSIGLRPLISPIHGNAIKPFATGSASNYRRGGWLEEEKFQYTFVCPPDVWEGAFPKGPFFTIFLNRRFHCGPAWSIIIFTGLGPQRFHGGSNIPACCCHNFHSLILAPWPLERRRGPGNGTRNNADDNAY